ncbi:MAG: hypothetical protein AB7I04_23750, partial [Pseudomonadales bacterium]
MGSEGIRALGATLACWLLAGCAEPAPTADERAALTAEAGRLAGSLADLPVAAPDGLVVRLMFDEHVDLDLYVTDPLLETVYFARHDSRTGGRIVSDVRCDTSGPRGGVIRV